MKCRLKNLALSVLGLLLVGSAGATTLMQMSPGDMAVSADAIVIGNCVSAESRRADGSVMTVVEISVDEMLKGDSVSRVSMVIPGGIDTSRPVPVAVIFPGAPSVVRDEKVLLFLNESKVVSGAYDVVGFSQGVYEVVEDSTGNQLVAQGRFSGDNGESLEAMKAEIRQALGE